MTTSKMHADERDIDASLVGRLLAAQFPEWAGLPLEPVSSAGTENAIFRLGNELAVRLPRMPSAAGPVDKVHRWLPELAPYLPLAVPVPLARGGPGEGYPWPWSICRWLEGENATAAAGFEPHQVAKDLARFVRALQNIHAVSGLPPGPPSGAHNYGRGLPLSRRDRQTRAAIADLRGSLDVEAVTRAWEAALQAPVWSGPPIWIHGDLIPGNLLVQKGRLSAVIDFGCLGMGDPACDVMVAWTLLTAESRRLFRAALAVDDATWARGRGWALSFGLIALPYYQRTNPTLAGIARRTIDEVLVDSGVTG